MQTGTPAAPPEARLIRLAREASGMTAQDAAEATKAHDGKGVSAAYWRDVERGSGGRRGQRVPTRASARALAAMASVVGIQPPQLSEAGREDAARVLGEIQRREPVLRLAPERLDDRRPAVTEAMAAAMEPYHRVIQRYIARARAKHPGQRLTGEQVFEDSPVDQATWNDLSPGRSDDLVGFLIASIWQEEAEQAAEKRRRDWGSG